LNADHVANIATLLVLESKKCLLIGKKHKLPSVAQAAVWSSFHQLRQRQDILQAWAEFIKGNIPVANLTEHKLALQLILDRMLKKIIATEVMPAAKATAATIGTAAKSLTQCESNAIRYMAGYIAVKLLKQYRKGSKNSAVSKKHL